MSRQKLQSIKVVFQLFSFFQKEKKSKSTTKKARKNSEKTCTKKKREKNIWKNIFKKWYIVRRRARDKLIDCFKGFIRIIQTEYNCKSVHRNCLCNYFCF